MQNAQIKAPKTPKGVFLYNREQNCRNAARRFFVWCARRYRKVRFCIFFLLFVYTLSGTFVSGKEKINSIIAVCAVVIAFATTLLASFLMNGADIISAAYKSGEVENDSRTSYWLVVFGGYGSYSLALQDATILQGLGAAGYVASDGAEYLVTLAAYADKTDAETVAGKTESAEIKEISWDEGSVAEYDGGAFSSLLSLGDSTFALLMKCAAELESGALSANGALSLLLSSAEKASETSAALSEKYEGTNDGAEAVVFAKSLYAAASNSAAVAADTAVLVSKLRYYAVMCVFSRRAFAAVYA